MSHPAAATADNPGRARLGRPLAAAGVKQLCAGHCTGDGGSGRSVGGGERVGVLRGDRVGVASNASSMTSLKSF